MTTGTNRLQPPEAVSSSLTLFSNHNCNQPPVVNDARAILPARVQLCRLEHAVVKGGRHLPIGAARGTKQPGMVSSLVVLGQTRHGPIKWLTQPPPGVHHPPHSRTQPPPLVTHEYGVQPLYAGLLQPWTPALATGYPVTRTRNAVLSSSCGHKKINNTCVTFVSA